MNKSEILIMLPLAFVGEYMHTKFLILADWSPRIGSLIIKLRVDEILGKK